MRRRMTTKKKKMMMTLSRTKLECRVYLEANVNANIFDNHFHAQVESTYMQFPGYRE